MPNYEAYRSPFRLLIQFGIDLENLTPEILALKKKELFLELQLDSDQMLDISGVKHTKNDVIQNFEELSNLEDLDFHLKVVQRKELVSFLEHQILPSERLSITIPFSSESEEFNFSEKLSRYLAFSINRVMGKVIRNGNYRDVLNLGSVLDWLRPGDYHLAFRKFITFNDDFQIAVTLPKIDGIRSEWEEFNHLDNPDLYELANLVDREVTNFAQKLTISVINLGVKYQRDFKRLNDIILIGELALRLHSMYSTKAILENNLKIQKRNLTRVKMESKSQTIPKIVSIGALIVFAIVICSLLFYSYDTEANNEIQQRNYTELQPIAKENPYNFGLTEFRKLHEKIVTDLTNDSLVKFTGSTTPKFSSVFNTLDESILSILVNRGTIINQTKYDLLVVVYSETGLRSFHLAPFMSSDHYISPKDEFFIYSGQNWNNSHGLEYKHFSPTQNRTYWLSFEGHFEGFERENLNLVQKRFKIPSGRQGTTVVKENLYKLIVEFEGQSLTNR